MGPAVWHSGGGKAIETRRPVVWGRERGRDHSSEHRVFRAGNLRVACHGALAWWYICQDLLNFTTHSDRGVNS